TTPPRLTLVCTATRYPSGLSDGACDHVFFDSLYRNYDSDFLYFPLTHIDFLNSAAKSNLTRFGLSIEVRTLFVPRHVILLGQGAYGRSKPCAVLPANNYIDPRQEKKELKHGHTVICDAWRDHGTSRIAISAYSVNADFPHPIFKCPKDQWKPNGSRLHFVQVFRDFLSKESSACNKGETDSLILDRRADIVGDVSKHVPMHSYYGRGQHQRFIFALHESGLRQRELRRRLKRCSDGTTLAVFDIPFSEYATVYLIGCSLSLFAFAAEFLDFGAYSARNLPECTSLALPRSTPWVCRSRAVFRCGRRTKRQLLSPEKPRAPSSAQPLHSHWPYLVTSWRYRTYLEAGTSGTAHAFNLDIKPTRIVAAPSGLGSTAMDRAKLPCLFLVQFLGFWCLQRSEPPGVHLACPTAVDTLGLPFTSRLSMWKADEAAAAEPEKPRAPSSAQPLHSHWPYLVTSWRYRTYLEAGTSGTAHAFNLDIKPTRIVAVPSGLGSTAMDRAKLPCLFLVQFLGFWCLQRSEPPGVHLACPTAVDTLGLPFTSRLSMWKADEAAAAEPEKPRAPSSAQPLHSHWPYL
ncbi:hypothetical protein MRX96_051390, partial [Rhipicephalus microplus]